MTLQEYNKERKQGKRVGETEDKYIYEVNVYDETHTTVALVPDVCVTFEEAWRVEKPPCLCFINRMAVDVQLENAHDAQDAFPAELLSSLDIHTTRRLLGKMVRDPLIIRPVMKKFVKALRDRKNTTPLARGIIFTMNDQSSDAVNNRHAKQCADILREEAPDLSVFILTMKEEAAATDMNGFLSEERLTHDVVIVKQMGNAGLDCKWLKVAADLSSVRSDTSYIQRMMRIATISVEDDLYGGDFVTPDDILGQDIFNRLVVDAGGALDMVTSDLIKTYKEERDKKTEDLRKLLFATGSELSDFQDSDGRWAPRTLAPAVALVRETFFGTSNIRTDPQIAEILTKKPAWLRAIQDDIPQDGAGSVNTETTRKDLRDSMVAIMRNATNTMLFGVLKKPYSSALWETLSKEAYKIVYTRAGIQLGTELKDIDAIETLERIRREAVKYEAEIHAQRRSA